MGIKLDFSKVKYESGDKKSTTLRHTDGHTIILSHGSLSEGNRKVLESLRNSKKPEDKEESPVKMKDGGMAKKIADDVTPDVMSMDSAPGPTDEQKDLQGRYNRIASSTDRQIDRFGMPLDEQENLDKMFGPHGEAPVDFQPSSFQKAVGQQEADQSQEQAALEANSLQIAEDNKVRAQAGLPPLPGGAVSQPELPVSSDTGIAPQTPGIDASPTYDPMAGVQSGLNAQKAGINLQAKAQAELGEQQSRVLQEQEAANKEAMSVYKQKTQTLESEREALRQDIRNGQIDPDKFWTGDPKTGAGGHSRIASAIGMIIAGFNPTNSPNAAINFLKFQMEQNLQAQQKNLSSKENLLAANLQQFGDLKSATEMTRIMQNDVVVSQLQQAASQAQTPLAKAAAMKAIGELDAANAERSMKFYAQQTVRDLEAQAAKDPSKTKALISALKVQDPERAKDIEQREVPGLGVASSLEGAKGLREMQATTKTVKTQIAELREILAKSGKSLSPDLRKKAESIRTQLIGRLRVPLTGPGAMSEGERTLLTEAIPNVSALFSLDSRSKVALDALEKGVLDSYRNMATANGLKVPEVQESRQSDPKAQAKAWLADPKNKNKPQYQSILKSVGGK